MFIKLVSARRIPSKVAQKIIEAVAVVMAGLKAFWTRAFEGKQNKTMDIKPGPFSIERQDHSLIPITQGLSEDCRSGPDGAMSTAISGTFPVRPNPSLIANFVPWPIGNCFPNLGDCVTFLSIHGGNLLDRFLLWQSRVRCSRSLPACSFIPQHLTFCQEIKGQNG
jgi:hypothetical protein